jgi:O-antigen ligase
MKTQHREWRAYTLRRVGALRRPDCATTDRIGVLGVALLLILAWARVTVTQLVHILSDGRPDFNSPVETMPAATRLLGDATTAVFLGTALLLIGCGLLRRRPRRPWELAVVLAPLCAIHLAGLLNGQHPGPVALALPAAIVAVWVLRPGPLVLATVGVLGAVTAAGSILLAVLRPDLALITGDGAGDKSWAIAGLLTGPYPHSNVLGLMLALSLPFVFSLRHPPSRRVALALILIALAWTGSRTSQLAALAVLLTWALLTRRPAASADRTVDHRAGLRLRLLIGVPVMAGLGLTVVSPLLVTDPASLTERGRIWRALLSRWLDQPLTGHGPGYLDRRPELVEALGGRYTHGHNLLVHLLAVGGLLAVALFAVLLGLVWRRSVHLAGLGRPAPALFLIALVWVSWLEASHVPVTLAGSLTWLPLCLIVWAGPSGPDLTRGSEDQAVP